MTIGPTWRVLGALIGGLLVGALSAGAPWSEPAVQIASTVGGLWLDALKMTVIPLIVALLVTGIVGGSDAAREGGVAGRSLLWFVVILTGSAVFGAVVMPLLLAAFPLPQAAGEALRAGLAGVDPKAAAAAVPGLADFVRSIVPANVVKAAADGSILQIVVFTALFAFAIARLDEAKRRPLAAFFDALTEAMLVVIGWVLWLAPAGVLALAFVVGVGAGGAAFGAVLHYIVLISSLGLAILLAAYVVAVLIVRWPLGRFARAMIAPQAVGISTQSSLASLPAMLAAARELGVPDKAADVTLPLAVALFRATGPAMNMGVAIYVAHWLGIALGPLALAAGVAVAATTTFGTVSLPGQLSFVTSIAPIALAMGVPIEPLAILIAVETIPDLFRTVGNVTMDVAVAGAVGLRREREKID
ncbi:MAG: dicarboxylate/amino acid:cation symporter [Sphingomicrobium sp.]|nr:dicarboxylate/amino acid:cation symporter [Sphingomonadales bacterium]